MKNIHVLGISENSISIIFDLFCEYEENTFFKLYPNISPAVIPSLPNKKINYKIMEVGEAPGINKKVFFGCATPQIKQAIYNHFCLNHKIYKLNYINLVHSSSYIASSTSLEQGILIEPNVVVSSQSKIGFGVYLKRGCLIGHHNEIGDFCDINPGVIISGKVTIGSACIIGSGTVIRDNIVIGENTIIGIGSVVTKNIPANCVAFGNPCKVVSVKDLG